MSVHPTANVEDGAEIGDDVVIGPYANIGADVRLGAGVRIGPHAVVVGRTEVGARTVVHPFAVLGGPPQHLAYRGEQTRLVVGPDCVIREHVTINIGTAQGKGVTTIGANVYMMTGSHIAHDCVVGDYVIFANNATLGGHTIIGDHVFLGGLCAIHQNSRIGDYAFVGGCAAVTADIIPYASAIGNHAELAGLNIIGLKRRGVPRETIRDMRLAYHTLFYGHDPFAERVAMVGKKFAQCPEVMRIVDFIKADARRSLMAPRR